MKISFFLSFFVVICFINFNSCVKAFPDSSKIVDKDLFKSIGIKHNLAVKYVFEHVDLLNINPDSVTSVTESLIKEVLPSESKIFQSSKISLDQIKKSINVGAKPDFKNDVSKLSISRDLKNRMYILFDLVAANLAIPEFESKLDNLENDAINNLDQKELSAFLPATSIARYSARLWTPVEKGGENKGLNNSLNGKNKVQLREYDFSYWTFGFEYYFDDIDQGDDPIVKAQKQSISPFWGELIGWDVSAGFAAAATSLIASGGLSAVPNPALGGVPTAGAIALFSGGFASAGYAFRQWVAQRNKPS